MTPIELVKELAEELRKVTEELYFEDENTKPVKMNVFEFSLPYQKYDDEQEPFPYIVVTLDSGSASQEMAENVADVTLYIGIRKADEMNDGKRHVLGVMQRIAERFEKNNMLKCFRQIGKISWALDSEDAYPYYFGGMSMRFQIFKIEREESIYA